MVFLIILASIIFLWITATIGRILVFSIRARKLIKQISPYQQKGIEKHSILIIGDSLAYGTGASSPATSLAGIIGGKFPRADLANKAVNGSTTKQLLDRINADIDAHYEVILIIIGANDIIRPYINLSKSSGNISKIYEAASKSADNVVALSTGNFYKLSFFPYPLNLYFGRRAKRLAHNAQREAKIHRNVNYINMATENYTLPASLLEAKDHLHLSDVGNKYWSDKILSILL